MNIEEEFFKAFGIEKRCIEKNPIYCCDYEGCDKCRGLGYPPITDRILLKLLCLLVNNVSPITFIAGEEDIGIKNIKNLILEACIKSYEIREQVQQLFKENE